MILIPEATLPNAIERAEQLWRSLEGLLIQYGSQFLNITCSAVEATVALHAKTSDGVILAVDEALYTPKLSGRNSVKRAIVKLSRARPPTRSSQLKHPEETLL